MLLERIVGFCSFFSSFIFFFLGGGGGGGGDLKQKFQGIFPCQTLN